MKSKILLLCLVVLSYGNYFASLDATFHYKDDIIVVIKGDKIIQYDMKLQRVLKTDFISQNGLPGIPFKKIDAAINFGNGKIYFFNQNTYARFDIATYKTDTGYPKPIAGNWPGVTFTSVDAALNWNGISFLFSGNQYVKFDNVNNTTFEGYPKTISTTTWGGIPFTSFDASVSYEGNTYFFKGDEYIVYSQSAAKMVAGYPKKLNEWTTLYSSLQDAASVAVPNINKSDYAYHDIVKKTIDLAPYKMKSPNSVLADFTTTVSKEGLIYLAFQQEHDVIILTLNKNYERINTPIELKNYWLSEININEKGEIELLLGRSIDNTYIEKYPNTLYFVKLSNTGEQLFNTYLFGGKGHGPQKSWFDGRSKARLTCNGSEYGIYFEVQKNFATTGKDDIHNGDMFMVTDINGVVKNDRTHSWTASHSNTLQAFSSVNNDFYTMTIGDANPYGLQVYNRTTKTEHVPYPPKEDFVPYEKVNSTNAAGILHYSDENNGNLIAILGSLEHPNIGVFTKVDPLFLKISKDGQVLSKKWLKVTPDYHESNISITKIGVNYVIMWSAGNVYENDWLPSTEGEICIVDGDGNFIKQPTKINMPFGTSSSIASLSPKRVYWFEQTANYSSTIDLYTVTFMANPAP
jgi:hypothetical protein